MKIYILPVSPEYQPRTQPFIYPAHNRDFGVEQDFYHYLLKHKDIVVESPGEADWHYLPIYWTRWHLNHEYAKTGLADLQEEVDKVIIDGRRTFTICQYDDGPIVNLPKVRIFLSSRKTNKGEDIPLLSTQHVLPLVKPKKKYLASFVGRIATHKIRSSMRMHLENIDGINIVDGDIGVRTYVKTLLQSYVALCPRGYGGSSFRFYEAMQLGVVPFLIGDLDTRPFKGSINWERCSMYTNNPKYIMPIINSYPQSRLLEMGRYAKEVWKHELQYQKWCNLALDELE